MTQLFDQMKEAILNYDEDQAVKLAEQALSEGVKPMDAIEKGFAKGMDEVGKKFDELEIFLPEVMLAADTMIAAVEVLKKGIKSGESATLGKVVLGTIKGDIHDIGKNIVKTMLMASGFQVYDLGKDVSPNALVDKAKEVDADVIAMSALCTSTMLHMPDVCRILTEDGVRDQYKVIMGGAPVLPDWAKKMGADGYGETASEAVDVCRKLLGR